MKTGNEKGAVLVATLLVLVLLSILGAGALMSATVDTKISGNLGKSKKAFYAAEAGLEVGAGTLMSHFTNNLYPYEPTAAAVEPSTAGGDPFDGADFDGYRVTYTISNPSDPANPATIPPAAQFTTSLAGQQLMHFSYVYRIEGEAAALTGNTAEKATETLRVLETPLVQYYIFFNDDLSIHPGPQMTSWGRIHTNGDLGFANQGVFTFNDFDANNNSSPNTITVHGRLRHTSYLQQAAAVIPNSVWANRATANINVRVHNVTNPPTAPVGGDYVLINTSIDNTNQAAQEARFTDGPISHVKVGVDSLPTVSFNSLEREGFNATSGFYERAALNPQRPGVDGMLITADNGELNIKLTMNGKPWVDVTNFVRDYQVAVGRNVNLAAWPVEARTRADGTGDDLAAGVNYVTGLASTVGTNTPQTDVVAGSIVYSPEAPVRAPFYVARTGRTHKFTAAGARKTGANYNHNAADNSEFLYNPWYPCVLETFDGRENRKVDFTVIDMQQLQRWYYDYVDWNELTPGDADGWDTTTRSLLVYATRSEQGTNNPVPGSGVNALQAIKLIGSQAGRTRGNGAGVGNQTATGAVDRQTSPTFMVRTSLVTPEPVYFEGDFNAPNAGNTVTPSYAPGMGSAVICDAATFLSNNWSSIASKWNVTESAHAGSGAYQASHTTFNTALFTGRYNYRLGGGGEEAGIHNFTRFLENWGGASPGGNDPVLTTVAQPVTTITGCLINLWFSDRAVAPHAAPNDYYSPPYRNFGWDVGFANFSYWPPYVPSSYTIERESWQEN